MVNCEVIGNSTPVKFSLPWTNKSQFICITRRDMTIQFMNQITEQEPPIPIVMMTAMSKSIHTASDK